MKQQNGCKQKYSILRLKKLVSLSDISMFMMSISNTENQNRVNGLFVLRKFSDTMEDEG